MASWQSAVSRILSFSSPSKAATSSSSSGSSGSSSAAGSDGSEPQQLVVAALAPQHGPLVSTSLQQLTRQYRLWTQEQLHMADKAGNVVVLYASAYGNTAALAQVRVNGGGGARGGGAVCVFV